jgi:hypothetical protein
MCDASDKHAVAKFVNGEVSCPSVSRSRLA